jgi:hypothetical protein
MAGIGFRQVGNSKYASPGHWNDPDMLVIGKVGWGPRLRDSHLTANEQYVHLTLWTLLASPLLLGNDLTQILDRAPTITLADLKPGDAIIVLSTVGANTESLTAITLLAGVEPILTRPGTREMSLGGWSLGAGGGGEQ